MTTNTTSTQGLIPAAQWPASSPPADDRESQPAPDGFAALLAAVWFTASGPAPALNNKAPAPQVGNCGGEPGAQTAGLHTPALTPGTLTSDPALTSPPPADEMPAHTGVPSLDETPAPAAPPPQDVPAFEAEGVEVLPGHGAQKQDPAEALHAEGWRQSPVTAGTVLAELKQAARRAFSLTSGEPSAARPALRPTGQRDQPQPEPKADVAPDGRCFLPTDAAAPKPEAAPGAPARAIAGQVVSPLLEAAEHLSPHQTRTIRIRLNPERLGQVEIAVTSDPKGQLSAHITAAEDEARRLLAGSITHLRETLEAAGLSFDRLAVGAGWTNAGAGHDSGRRPESGPDTTQPLLFPPGQTADDDAAPGRAVDLNRLLSVRA